MPKKNGGNLNLEGRGDEMVLMNNAPARRDEARRALHKIADGDETFLDEMTAMLGLYISDKDIAGGFSRIPCVVDGKVRTKHKTYPPPRIKPRSS